MFSHTHTQYCNMSFRTRRGRYLAQVLQSAVLRTNAPHPPRPNPSLFLLPGLTQRPWHDPADLCFQPWVREVEAHGAAIAKEYRALVAQVGEALSALLDGDVLISSLVAIYFCRCRRRTRWRSSRGEGGEDAVTGKGGGCVSVVRAGFAADCAGLAFSGLPACRRACRPTTK